MEYILEDFVNREDAIQEMWLVARQEAESRLVVVCGERGIGKTYLLEEFLGEYQKEARHWVEIDFQSKIDNPAYLMVVMEAWKRLGPAGFETLRTAIDEVINQAVPTQYRQIQPPLQAVPGGASTQAAGDPTSSGTGQAAPGAGLAFYGDTNVYGNIAGRDFYLLLQVVQRDDPYIRKWAMEQVTAALKDCLAAVTQQKSVVFFIDHWEEADEDTQRWLSGSLLSWAANLEIPSLAVIVACVSAVDIKHRRRTKQLPLGELTSDAVNKYLIQKRKIPSQDLGQFELAGGNPYLLAMLAERYRRKIDALNRTSW